MTHDDDRERDVPAPSSAPDDGRAPPPVMPPPGADASSWPGGVPSDEGRLAAEFPPLEGLPDLASVLSDIRPLEARAQDGRAPGPDQLSPEIQAMLEAAAHRVEVHSEPVRAAAEPHRVLVSAEMMATVEDFLTGGPDDDVAFSGRGGAEAMPAPTMLRTQPPASEASPPEFARQPDRSSLVRAGSAPPPTRREVVSDDSLSAPPLASDRVSGSWVPPVRPPASSRGATRVGTYGGARSWSAPASMPPSRRAPSLPAATDPRDRLGATPSTPPVSASPLEDLGASVGHETPESSPIGFGDPLEMLARAVRGRRTGALAFDDGAGGGGTRRIYVREGDLTHVTSDAEDDDLLRFLIVRGDLAPEAARGGAARHQSGRHAAAALIARGLLEQDDLWPTLRAHGEWLVARVLRGGATAVRLESAPSERFGAEPNVFGGAAGAEIFVEAVRRVLPPEAALERLGGPKGRIDAGPRGELLVETALDGHELAGLRDARGQTIDDVLRSQGVGFAPLLFALEQLKVVTIERADRPLGARRDGDAPAPDPLDADAVRRRVEARLALVREADYFTLLGLERVATSYEVRRAYLDLRRSFEPARLLTAATADLGDDVRLIVEVIEEAYDVLREPARRRRYQRALEASRPRR
ncbi:MAG: hypothetical protein AAF928_05485 [Myxococcota bacterium]